MPLPTAYVQSYLPVTPSEAEVLAGHLNLMLTAGSFQMRCNTTTVMIKVGDDDAGTVMKNANTEPSLLLQHMNDPGLLNLTKHPWGPQYQPLARGSKSIISTYFAPKLW